MTKPRILIIEDEHALTDVLCYNLQREGFDTAVAHDGQEGLRKAQTILPDFVMLAKTSSSIAPASTFPLATASAVASCPPV